MPSILNNLLLIGKNNKKLQMDSYIVEDVNALLKLKRGDINRLNHIKQLCDSNELISLSDRKYIERLAYQYLHKPEIKKPKKQDEPKFVPIEESETETLASDENIQKVEAKLVEVSIPEDEEPEKKPSKSFDLSSNKKIVFGIAAIILAIILIGAVAIATDRIQIPSYSGTKDIVVPEFSLETDESSYETADIISISGQILSSTDESVRLSIENENNVLIWAENVNLKSDGKFATLLIAGGQGWENSGEYILTSEHNDSVNQISFEFISKN